MEKDVLKSRAQISPMTIEQIIAEEIRDFKMSPQYRLMREAEKYYINISDVQNKSNPLANRSNTKIEHPILKKLIDQKVNYLLARDFSLETQDMDYAQQLASIFDDSMRKKLKSFVRGAIKSGICWLQPYFENGRLRFMRLPATQVVPLWVDSEHTQLEGFIRFYDQVVYEGMSKKIHIKVEYWHLNGVDYYVSTNGGSQFTLDNDKGFHSAHFDVGGKPYNWREVPIVWIKYTEEELPLFYFVKSLIDDLNWQKSITADELRDIAKFVYVLRNYMGEDLDTLLDNLRKYMAINVGDDGGVDKLSADINVNAVMQFMEMQRRDIYDYSSCVDTMDPNLGNASGTAIQFRYTDLDNDCNGMAGELKESLRRLKLFIDFYIELTTGKDYSEQPFNITFNMDMPVNETDVINNARNSQDIVSHNTILENHPWVKNVGEELARLDKEKTMNRENHEIFGNDVLAGG